MRVTIKLQERFDSDRLSKWQQFYRSKLEIDNTSAANERVRVAALAADRSSIYSAEYSTALAAQTEANTAIIDNLKTYFQDQKLLLDEEKTRVTQGREEWDRYWNRVTSGATTATTQLAAIVEKSGQATGAIQTAYNNAGAFLPSLKTDTAALADQAGNAEAAVRRLYGYETKAKAAVNTSASYTTSVNRAAALKNSWVNGGYPLGQADVDVQIPEVSLARDWPEEGRTWMFQGVGNRPGPPYGLGVFTRNRDGSFGPDGASTPAPTGGGAGGAGGGGGGTGGGGHTFVTNPNGTVSELDANGNVVATYIQTGGGAGSGPQGWSYKGAGARAGGGGAAETKLTITVDGRAIADVILPYLFASSRRGHAVTSPASVRRK